MAERRPPRVHGGVHDEFWSWCARGELRIQRCEHCQHLSWPPTERCEACDGEALSWERLTGEGKLVSWCTFERRYYEELSVPWETIVVELDEGPLFISDPSGFSVDQAKLGDRVSVEFLACEDDVGNFHLPVFTRRRAASSQGTQVLPYGLYPRRSSTADLRRPAG